MISDTVYLFHIVFRGIINILMAEQFSGGLDGDPLATKHCSECMSVRVYPFPWYADPVIIPVAGMGDIVSVIQSALVGGEDEVGVVVSSKHFFGVPLSMDLEFPQSVR